MTLEEFKEFIEDTENELIKSLGRTGVCVVLSNPYHGCEVSRDFEDHFKPKVITDAYWLGPTTPEYLPLRIQKLREFEKLAIEKKLYERY